jgi:hypothetical protein
MMDALFSGIQETVQAVDLSCLPKDKNVEVLQGYFTTWLQGLKDVDAFFRCKPVCTEAVIQAENGIIVVTVTPSVKSEKLGDFEELLYQFFNAPADANLTVRNSTSNTQGVDHRINKQYLSHIYVPKSVVCREFETYVSIRRAIVTIIVIMFFVAGVQWAGRFFFSLAGNVTTL